MRRMLMVGLVLWVGLVSPVGSAANAAVLPEVGCTAEIAPRVVSAGTQGQSFTLRVYDGPEAVSSPVVIEPISAVVAIPQGNRITVTSASAIEWLARVTSSGHAIYTDGQIGITRSDAFGVSADVGTFLGTTNWDIYGSRDEGKTLFLCQPAYAGALDLTVQ